MLKTFVKISQVNNLSDARYCAGMGVNDLGFNVEPGTVHYVAPEEYKEIINWVAGVRPVAEFSTVKAESLARLINDYAVGAIQVATLEQLAVAQSFSLPTIFSCSAATFSTTISALGNLEIEPEYILLQANSLEELATLTDYLGKTRVVASGNFSATEFKKILSQYPTLYGIAMAGGVEIRAGYKDFDELAEVLEAMESEEES